jgi:hypothetical protein
MRGVDRSGNVEAYPASAETSTSIIVDFCSSPDSWETDNTYADANEITLADAGRTHNFCNPVASDWLSDEDWVKFNATAGKLYVIGSSALAENTAAMISLYASDGSTLIAEATASDFGRHTSLPWRATQDGWVYIRIRHIDGRVAGNSVTYIIRIFDQVFFMPLIGY